MAVVSVLVAEHTTIVGDYGEEVHLFTSRTQKLSSSSPRILAGALAGNVGRCQHPNKAIFRWLFCCTSKYST